MSETTTQPRGILAALSEELAGAVERAGGSIVRVEARQRQSATGIVWSGDGLILTADHVVERDEDIRIGLPDGRTMPARLAGRDPGTDLALLRVEASGLAPIARGAAPRVGHLVLVVGRPGDRPSATRGVVSIIGGPARTRRGGMLDGFICTDATMLPGFSGGPMIDTEGRLVGLATSHFGMGSGGFALPVETLDRVATQLARGGKVRRGYLGISGQVVQLPPALRQVLALDQASGLLVLGTDPNGPTAQALVIGDIVLSFAGQPETDHDALQALLRDEQVGRPAVLRVLRAGEPRDVTVTVAERA